MYSTSREQCDMQTMLDIALIFNSAFIIKTNLMIIGILWEIPFIPLYDTRAEA